MKRHEIILILESLLKDNSKKKLHISLSNRRFYNGVVLNFEDEKTMSFFDIKLGYIALLFSQIINIEPMVTK